MGDPACPSIFFSLGAIKQLIVPNSPAGYAPYYMELSLEAYRNVVKNVGSRADIVALCRVSKGFRYVAERALYNTLYMRDAQTTISLCDTLAGTPRLAGMVDALTISPSGEESDDEQEEGEEDEEERKPPVVLPENYWESVASALTCINRLRYLNLHLHNSPDTSTAWILDNCTFRLRRFHCDLDWDHHLVEFLNKQVALDDLYIIDYNDTKSETPTNVAPSSPALLLDTHALPNLSTLECTFSEAALTLVPDRPITHLKTCFSRSDTNEKREEMASLFSKINQSTRPLRALDIADSSYQDRFSMELLATVVNTPATNHQLRYLGTLVLPIAGKEVRSNSCLIYPRIF